MLKYTDAVVTFAEIPNEITLCINISNCPIHCPGCHSKYLWEDVGEPLNLMHLCDLIDGNIGITCVCIMGGDADPIDVDMLAGDIKEYYELKTAWYSGRQELSKDITLDNFDFIKLGPYIEKLGGLDSKTTNQRMYKVEDNKLIDITNSFWKHEGNKTE
jgi:anaerobic ribonucleoside-triphosphate reductase activating protein